jgi:hypothetical protein
MYADSEGAFSSAENHNAASRRLGFAYDFFDEIRSFDRAKYDIRTISASCHISLRQKLIREP